MTVNCNLAVDFIIAARMLVNSDYTPQQAAGTNQNESTPGYHHFVN